MSVAGLKKAINKIFFVLKRRKPRLVIKLVKIYFGKMRFGKYPSFRQVEIQTSFACNLKCVHCSAANFKPAEDSLRFLDYREIARQCRENNVSMVSFTGGEPLFDSRLEDIVRLFDTDATLISITTNGTLLTSQRAKTLKSIGVDCFVISIDGASAETNDPIRGQGTFERIIKAIHIARSYRFFVMMIHVLSHQSIKNGDFDNLIRLAETLKVPLHVSLASPTGNWATDEAVKDLILKQEDIDYLWACQRKYSFVRRDLDGNYAGVGCPAGTERFVISPTGEVLPCTKIQASFGNVKRESMLDLQEKMTRLDVFSSSPPVCLVAEDRRFLREYLPRAFGRKDLPLAYTDYFGLEELLFQSCPACGSKGFYQRYWDFVDYEYRVPFFPTLLQCRNCGLIRHEKIPRYDELKAFYPDDYLVYNESFRSGSNFLFSQLKKKLYEMRAKRVAKYIGPQGNMLDVGCANGAFLLSMKQFGNYSLHGLDIKNTGIDFKKHAIHFKEGPLEEIDYPGDFFDAVILDNLLEHVPDPVAFMNKARSILKPNGYIFGTTPNFNSIDRWIFGKYWGGFHMPRHIFLFNATNIRMFLENMGFVDIKLPPVSNAGDWAVSFQNYFRRKRKSHGKYKRGLYFPVVGLSLAPIAYLSSIFALNGVMDFICRKATHAKNKCIPVDKMKSVILETKT